MMSGHVPYWSSALEFEELRLEILRACEQVFRQGHFILGPNVASLEQTVAQYVGAKGAVGVNSGTDALGIALRALGIGYNDEVITVPNTAVPTVSAILSVGARPVLVDVGHDGLMDIDLVESAITEKTRAVVPVHLYGQCVDLDPLLEIAARHNLSIIEDCAHAFGALYRGKHAGSIGDVAAFSFYPTKILGAYGDGGMIASNSSGILELARSIRHHGITDIGTALRMGVNSRLDEIHAAILNVKIARVEQWIARRRNIAMRYAEALKETRLYLPIEHSYGRHVYHLMVVEHDEPDAFIQRMATHGVECRAHYRVPLHMTKGFEFLGYRQGAFPVAERKAARVVSLPIYPQLSAAQQDLVISAAKACE